MINILCAVPDSLTLGEMNGFQDGLKKRTEKDIKALEASIKADGLIMPFAIWKNSEGLNMLLDGHGRLAALTEIALQDHEVAEQPLPVIYISAESEEQARKSLLQITSSYGRITREGAVQFCRTIPEYHAPSIDRFVHRKHATRKTDVNNKNSELIRIRVPADKADAVRELFKQVDYIEVL